METRTRIAAAPFVRLLAFAIASAAGVLCDAKPVPAERAARVAGGWAAGGRGISGNVRTFSAGGKALFHLVEMDGGGFVAVAGDDAEAPLIGFSGSGALPSKPDGGPLWTVLCGRRASRSALSVSNSVFKGAARRRSRRRARPARGKRRSLSWEALERQSGTAAGPSARPLSAAASVASIDGLDDVPVPPLLQSRWNQGAVGGKPVYNSVTPGNSPCGCVATAMAQLMRFHRHPQGAAAQVQRLCSVNGSTVSLSTSGGPYGWDAMPPVPSAPVPDSACEAIGALCRDAGVAVNMQYGSYSSNAFNWMVPWAMTNVFGYSSAHTMSDQLFKEDPGYDGDYGGQVRKTVENAILANLDAGFPVIVGLYDESLYAGHSVVADGYGWSDGTLFCHLNMGWSGECDFWYALPQVDAMGYGFDLLDTVEYNIFPEGGDCELVTGRVFDCDGEPAAGAAVTAVYTPSSNSKPVVLSAVTSAAGVYVFRIPPFTSMRTEKTVTLSATFDGRSSTNVPAVVRNNVSPVVDADSGLLPYGLDYSCPLDASGKKVPPRIGNVWGVALELAPAECDVAARARIEPPAGTGSERTVSLSFTGTPYALYKIQWRESLDRGDWADWGTVLVPASGQAFVEIPAEGRDSSFFCVVPAVQAD